MMEQLVRSQTYLPLTVQFQATVVTGQDAEKASIQYIIDGKQSMTVFKDVRTLVKDAMGMAVDILDGKTPETTGSYDNGKIEVKAKQTNVIVVE